METKDFERLQQRIEDAKREHAQATGALKSLEEKWSKSYGFTDPESAQNKLQELRAKHKENEEAITEVSAKLEKLTDWNTV